MQVQLWLAETGFPNPEQISLGELERALASTGVETGQYSGLGRGQRKVSITQFRQIIQRSRK